MFVRKKPLLVALFLLLTITGALWGMESQREEPVIELYDLTLAAGSEMPMFYIKTDRKAVALTLDISWGKEVPEKVLDVLKEQNQEATFFLSGPWSNHYKDVVRRIVTDGHEIASHGQDHVNLSQESRDSILSNIQTAHNILVNLTRTTPKFFRPPNGDYNNTVVLSARELGYETVIWAVDSRDWMNPGVATIVSEVSKNTFPGAILLFHASDSARETHEALPMVLQNLKTAGYEIMPLGQLLALGKPARDDPRGRPLSDFIKD